MIAAQRGDASHHSATGRFSARYEISAAGLCSSSVLTAAVFALKREQVAGLALQDLAQLL